MEKVIDVRDKYCVEICNINNILNQLKIGKVYDLTGNKMDGALFVHIEKLELKLEDLLNKIENSGVPDMDRLKKASEVMEEVFKI